MAVSSGRPNTMPAWATATPRQSVCELGIQRKGPSRLHRLKLIAGYAGVTLWHRTNAPAVHNADLYEARNAVCAAAAAICD
ncbi:hypothetical protein EVAR_18713_1 [Eumeta japonica]|uniref:Uncharacterized protein n=1 Tax=Eumeta variegata TaxID=151549 RepID=A0A4C1UMW3_EUMVA|nr:hypothetical protein EVAR_18713_1 [Eumeta japonica]